MASNDLFGKIRSYQGRAGEVQSDIKDIGKGAETAVKKTVDVAEDIARDVLPDYIEDLAIGTVKFLLDSTLGGLFEDDVLEDNLVNKKSNVAKIPVVYGQKRVGGNIVFIGSNGTNDEYLHLIISLCEGEIESIDEVWINDIKSTDSRFTGFVDIYGDTNSVIAARTRYGFVGRPSQAAPSTLNSAFDTIDSNFKLSGVAYLYIRLLYDSDVFSGIPNILCDIRGKRVVDTRTATTTLDTAEAIGQTTLGVTSTAGVAAIVTTGAFIVGQTYTIVNVGDTSFTSIGATSNTTGIVFTATGVGGGTIGTAWPNGDMASITLDDGTVVEATITTIATNDTITIYDALPVAASSGNLVEFGGYSQNPALCVRDYLYNDLYGKGLPLDAIDDSAIDTAANTCDTRMEGREDLPDVGSTKINGTVAAGVNQVNINEVTGGWVVAGDIFTLPNDTTQYLITAPLEASKITSSGAIIFTPAARAEFTDNAVLDFKMNYFETNGLLKTSRKVFDNVKLLMTSCRGMLPFTAGKYTLIIEQGGSSTFSFDVDNIIGGWSFSKGSKRYRLNSVKAKFSNPSKYWREDIVIQSSTTYKTEDGGFLLEREVPLLLETNPYRALYMANTVLKKSRQDINVGFTASIAALNVRVGDIVDLTHVTPGWVNKAFRVVSISLLASGNVGCQLQEHDDAVYNRIVEAGVSFPPDTNLPNQFDTRVSAGIAELQVSNWAERANPKNFALNAVAYGGGLFVAAGTADGTDAYLVTSSNGINWTERTNPKNFGINAIAYGSGVFVAVGGEDGTDAYIISSSNGASWTERTNSKNKGLISVAYGGGLFVAVGTYDGTDAYILTSPDGATWTERSNPVTYLYGVAYGGGLFVAVGLADGTDADFVTSTDGITWTEITNPHNTNLDSIAYGSGLFVAVGTGYAGGGGEPYILTSDDGITWTQQSTDATNGELVAITYGNGLFVAATYGGTATEYTIITSINGADWTPRLSPAPEEIYALSYGNKVFVATGNVDGTDAYILTSLFAP